MWNLSRVTAPEELRLTLNIMLGQLKRQRLEVGLFAAEEQKHCGHKIRGVNNENPEWYKELCSRHTVNRTNKRKRYGKKHHDTKISRKRIMETLGRLGAGKESKSIYAEELLELAKEVKEEFDADGMPFGEPIKTDHEEDKDW